MRLAFSYIKYDKREKSSALGKKLKKESER